MSTSERKLVHRWIDLAMDCGWRVTLTGAGHYRFLPPVGPPIFMGSTPRGGRRSIENARADLRRAGLPI